MQLIWYFVGFSKLYSSFYINGLLEDDTVKSCGTEQHFEGICCLHLSNVTGGSRFPQPLVLTYLTSTSQNPKEHDIAAMINWSSLYPSKPYTLWSFFFHTHIYVTVVEPLVHLWNTRALRNKLSFSLLGWLDVSVKIWSVPL